MKTLVEIYKGITESKFNIGDYIKLSDYYDRTPHQDELLWDYIGTMDYDDLEFEIIEIDVNEYFDKIKDQLDYADPDQKTLINQYKNDLDSIQDSLLVVDDMDKIIVDGNHRLVGAKFGGLKKLKAIDLTSFLE